LKHCWKVCFETLCCDVCFEVLRWEIFRDTELRSLFYDLIKSDFLLTLWISVNHDIKALNMA
jgi:hypothetical protein